MRVYKSRYLRRRPRARFYEGESTLKKAAGVAGVTVVGGLTLYASSLDSIGQWITDTITGSLEHVGDLINWITDKFASFAPDALKNWFTKAWNGQSGEDDGLIQRGMSALLQAFKMVKNWIQAVATDSSSDYGGKNFFGWKPFGAGFSVGQLIMVGLIGAAVVYVLYKIFKWVGFISENNVTYRARMGRAFRESQLMFRRMRMFCESEMGSSSSSMTFLEKCGDICIKIKDWAVGIYRKHPVWCWIFIIAAICVAIAIASYASKDSSGETTVTGTDLQKSLNPEGKTNRNKLIAAGEALNKHQNEYNSLRTQYKALMNEASNVKGSARASIIAKLEDIRSRIESLDSLIAADKIAIKDLIPTYDKDGGEYYNYTNGKRTRTLNDGSTEEYDGVTAATLKNGYAYDADGNIIDTVALARNNITVPTGTSWKTSGAVGADSTKPISGTNKIAKFGNNTIERDAAGDMEKYGGKKINIAKVEPPENGVNFMVGKNTDWWNIDDDTAREVAYKTRTSGWQ